MDDVVKNLEALLGIIPTDEIFFEL